jgi:hypothetical protein
MKTKIALSLLVSFTACLTTLVATSCKTGQTPSLPPIGWRPAESLT